MEHGILQADVVHHDDENREAANRIELRNSSLHAISYANEFRAVTARQTLNDARLPAAGRARPYNTVLPEVSVLRVLAGPRVLRAQIEKTVAYNWYVFPRRLQRPKSKA